MINIGVYSSGNSDSSYINCLEKKYFSFFSFGNEIEIERFLNFKAIIFDFSDEKNEESIGQICALLRSIQNRQIPFIFILLKESTKIERLIYLEFGATLVFDQETDPNEFSLIVSNLLCKKENQEQLEIEVKEKEEIHLNKHKLSIILEGNKEVLLTPLEYKLLDLLMQKKKQGSTYEEIYQVLWGEDMGSSRHRIANLVFLVRHKIEKDPINPEYLKTIRTKGYVLGM